MSLNPTAPTLPPPGGPRPIFLGLSRFAWLQIAVVAALFFLVYWSNLWRLWAKTNLINGTAKDDWSHSMLVPVIGLYYLYLRRDDLLSRPVRPLMPTTLNRPRLLGGMVLVVAGLATWLGFGLESVQEALRAVPFMGSLSGYLSSLGLGAACLGVLVLALDWGLGTLVGGLALTAYGIHPGYNHYVQELGMVLALFGTVLTLCGWRVMGVAWFPIVFLVCALPWPSLVYTKVAIPLQNLAAQVAVIVMNIAQVDAVVEGTRIVISKATGVRVLNVAEACAGMRSLMTFITIGTAMAFLSLSRPMWQKLIIVASAVPIAIICNVMRVSAQGLVDVYITEAATEGFTHGLVGLIMLIPAFFMLLGVGWILDQVIVEEEDETKAVDTAPAGAETAGTRAGMATGGAA